MIKLKIPFKHAMVIAGLFSKYPYKKSKTVLGIVKNNYHRNMEMEEEVEIDIPIPSLIEIYGILKKRNEFLYLQIISDLKKIVYDKIEELKDGREDLEILETEMEEGEEDPNKNLKVLLLFFGTRKSLIESQIEMEVERAIDLYL